MKNKLPRILFIVVLVSLLTTGVALACSPAPDFIRIKCSNAEFEFYPYRELAEGEFWSDNQDFWNTVNQKVVKDIIPECAEDLTPVLTFFNDGIVEWIDENIRGVFISQLTTIETYSEEKENKIAKSNLRIYSCTYQEYKHIGDWLIIRESSRPYCYEDWGIAGGCPVLVMDPFMCLLSFFDNSFIEWIKLLFGLFLAAMINMYSFWILGKNRRSFELLELIVITLGIFIGNLSIIGLPLWIYGRIFGWGLMIGILIFLKKVLKTRKRSQ